jgi:hypothetical protein
MYHIAARSGDVCIAAYNQEDAPWQCDARWALIQSFAMLLSTDYEFLTRESKAEKLLMIVSIVFSLVVGILRTFCCFRFLYICDIIH